jgi:Bacterial regulatory proteins, gntR family
LQVRELINEHALRVWSGPIRQSRPERLKWAGVPARFGTAIRSERALAGRERGKRRYVLLLHLFLQPPLQAPRLLDRLAQLEKEPLTGRFPPGARLIERDLTKTLGTSRTPIREALRQLERDGLVISTRTEATS